MAQGVMKLEERALALQLDVFRLTPRQYIEHDNCGPDPLGLSQAWGNAGAAVTEAYLALEHLGDILRDKAGIEDWEPGDEIHTSAPTDPTRSEQQCRNQEHGR